MTAIVEALITPVNSAARCGINSYPYTESMTRRRPAKIESVHVEESALLKKLFAERATVSQEKFGLEYEIGTQGMVSQYLLARSPLNLSSALKFAKGLNCEIAEFSPRLAEELRGVAIYDQKALPGTADRSGLDKLAQTAKKRVAELDSHVSAIKAISEKYERLLASFGAMVENQGLEESIEEIEQKLHKKIDALTVNEVYWFMDRLHKRLDETRGEIWRNPDRYIDEDDLFKDNKVA